jgi:hypothetical protein
MVALPTLSRADLLIRNKEFLESIESPDEVLILDNGDQQIDIRVPIEHAPFNRGVSWSWNFFMRRAFVAGKFDALVILQDDIIWDIGRLLAAKRLLLDHPDVSLFLSFLQFSVQVHRRENIETIGYYDERFTPAYCEDDDYAILMTSLGKVYERFTDLDPLPGSISEGTSKSIGVNWEDQNRKLVKKWGSKAFWVNTPHAHWYKTNRGVKF